MATNTNANLIINIPLSSSSDDSEDEEMHALLCDIDDFEICDGKPAGERCEPLGAPNDNEPELPGKPYGTVPCELAAQCSERERVQSLEEEQEILTSSLLSLTSHFAQVQFRLRQIVDAPPSDKESLIQALEEFAFRGIPEVGVMTVLPSEQSAENRTCQQELIEQLKAQLEDLESFAYETGEAGLPQSVVLERQKVIIDELKSKMNLNLDEMDKVPLSPEQLRQQVDNAIGKLVTPMKMKETLVIQLKTQIQDLERFIVFLQGVSDEEDADLTCNCDCSEHGHTSKHKKHTPDYKLKYSQRHNEKVRSNEKVSDNTIGITKKATELLNMFAAAQFGCGSDHFRKNNLKKTMKGNHWGDLRARLEIAVNEILLLQKKTTNQNDLTEFGDYISDSEDSPVMMFNVQLTTAVRKQLATAIRDIIQHGLIPGGQSTILVPFLGCFQSRNRQLPKHMHAWELILEYYKLKNGAVYNSTPARKLSQSFNLDIVVGTTISNKQNLLGAIASIIADHSPYKRSYDTHFKAFICSALNDHKLVQWLNLIFQCRPLMSIFYASWSYSTQTGFVDSLQTLDRLTTIKFDLPVNLAVRKFQNIKDVFM